MPKNDRYDVEEQPQDLPKDLAGKIFVQPGVVSVVKPRGPDRAQLQSENEELKTQLERLQAMLSGRPDALVVQDGSLSVQGFQFTPTGLVAPEDMTSESWEQIGHLLFRLEGSIQWLIGDWLAYGEDLQYGDVKQIAEAIGRDYKTLRNYMVVSRAVELSRRRDTLSYGHHEAVTKYDPDTQDQCLGFAEAENLTRADFRKWLREVIDGISSEPMVLAGPDVESTMRELKKFMQRDPAKAKPEEREQARVVIDEMLREIDEFRRKWGI